MNAITAGLAAIQLAVFRALDGRVGDLAVYEATPENAPMPFAVIGNDSAVDWSDKTSMGIEASVTVDVFADEGNATAGSLPAKRHLDTIVGVLTSSVLTFDEPWRIVGPVRLQSIDTEKGAGLVRGIARLRLFLQKGE